MTEIVYLQCLEVKILKKGMKLETMTYEVINNVAHVCFKLLKQQNAVNPSFSSENKTCHVRN